jgi:Bacterial capsule synthesis protein PGA_cap
MRHVFSLLLALVGAPALADPLDLTFSHACDPGPSFTIAAVGDVLLHNQLQAQIQSSGYRSLWSDAMPLLQEADLAYANHEGPAAEGVTRNGRVIQTERLFDGVAYTGYPTFNYHPQLEAALLDAGFDYVSTANNHSMDRGALGADKTIFALQAAGLAFSGTRTAAESLAGTSTSWRSVVDKSGFRTVWISCTFSTNGLPDREHQVLMCFSDAELIERAIRELSADPTVDAVILTPHWGEQEYTHVIEPSQRWLAYRFLNAGATAIFGNHPHVTKPWEKFTTADGRETFVIYSIGNFVSAQATVPKQTSAIVYLGLTKKPGAKAVINGVRYVPLWMNRAPYSLTAGDRTPNEARALLTRLLGSERRMADGERVVTNPECR